MALLSLYPQWHEGMESFTLQGNRYLTGTLGNAFLLQNAFCWYWEVISEPSTPLGCLLPSLAAQSWTPAGPSRVTSSPHDTMGKLRAEEGIRTYTSQATVRMYSGLHHCRSLCCLSLFFCSLLRPGWRAVRLQGDTKCVWLKNRMCS